MRRRLATTVVAATLLLGACDDGGSPVVEPAPGDTTGSTASGAASTTVGTDPADATQPALWPAPEVVFQDPVAAATDFLELVIGGGTAGEFRAGDARSGEVEVFFAGEDGNAGNRIVRSTLLLRQLGAEDGWFVIAAVNPNAAITSPASGAEVPRGQPLRVEGIARGFEASVVVSALTAGLPGDPLAEVVTTGGALADPEPFAVDLDLSGATPGQVVTLLVRGGTGLEEDPGDFGAIPVVIEV